MNIFVQLTREDKEKDFVEFVQERLEFDYFRNRIGRSRYENDNATINHALTLILKACAYAAELKMIDHVVNAWIQDMCISLKLFLTDEDNEFDSKYLTKEQLAALLEYYHCVANT